MMRSGSEPTRSLLMGPFAATGLSLPGSASSCSYLGNPCTHPVFSLPFVVLSLLIIPLSTPPFSPVLLPVFAFKMPEEKGSGPWIPRF